MYDKNRFNRVGRGHRAAGRISPADAGTGKLRITLAKAGLFVGIGTATGTLRFHGRYYPLSISGVSAGTIGVALTRLKGHAYNLRYAADIVGSYSQFPSVPRLLEGQRWRGCEIQTVSFICNWKGRKPAWS